MTHRHRFDKRIYRPERLLDDLRYMVEHGSQIRAAMRSHRVGKAFSKRIMLAVTGVNGCRYCSYAHTKTALQNGVSPDEARQILSGELSDAPADELPALLFAQHYAESGGQPDPEALDELYATYGPARARDILVHIRMITMGNLSGNTLDALLSRLKGQHVAGSTWADEVLTLLLLASAPLLAVLTLLRRLLPSLGFTEYELARREEVNVKTLVYGAGAIGSLYAARLAQSGQDVTLLARGERAEQVRQLGIELENLITGAQSTVPVPVVERLNPKDRYDLVLVCLPSDRLAEALPRLAANPHVPDILFLGNNVAGPAQLVGAVGRQRVLLGFPGAVGIRADNRIRYVDHAAGKRWPIVVGELDGLVTNRLAGIAALFGRAGVPVVFEPNMPAWLKTHAATVLPVASALYLADGDPYRLSRTRDGLVLLARAMEEGFEVLDNLGIPVTPPRLRLLQWLPEPLLVAVLRRQLQRPTMQFALAHATASRAETDFMATEFSTLASEANYATPVMDYLATYTNPETAPLADGSAQLGVNWRDVWIGLGALASGIATAILLGRLSHRPAAESEGE